MGAETPQAGLKAFLLVGVAYFFVAVLGPVLVLMQRGTNWSFTTTGWGGVTWSFIAGVAGALGAFTLVLALGAAGTPVEKGGGGLGAAASLAVMPIVFGGAPMVNALVNMLLHPPEGGLKAVSWQFIVGCVMAAVGAYLVASNAPTSAAAPKPGATAAPARH